MFAWLSQPDPVAEAGPVVDGHEKTPGTLTPATAVSAGTQVPTRDDWAAGDGETPSPAPSAASSAVSASTVTDDGYTVPMSAEEAGVDVSAEVAGPLTPGLQKVSLVLPSARCTKTSGGWLCTR